ncbi:MAG: RHS repeat-associated core domain-containing protein [Candidatus Riflebacteria bacterium]|nr:RHS repeat-associated core domain-containing protein [Candidatus Riflebacteria bacterium]
MRKFTNRYYSPKVGRFVSRDPIGFNGGNNLWGYAKNNPMRWVDPFGYLNIDEMVPEQQPKIPIDCNGIRRDVAHFLNFEEPRLLDMYLHWKPGETWATYGLTDLSTAVGKRTPGFFALSSTSQWVINNVVYSPGQTLEHVIDFPVVSVLGMGMAPPQERIWLTWIYIEMARTGLLVDTLQSIYLNNCTCNKDEDVNWYQP